jgi:hypothetical protein
VRDSIRQAAVADSIAAAVADSIAAAETDSIGAAAGDTAGVGEEEEEGAEEVEGAVADSIVEGLLEVVDSAGLAMEDTTAADSSQAMLLLSERPELSESWYVRLAASTVPGARYLLMAVAENLSGAVAESQGLLILPEPVDTTQVPADTT